MQSALAIFTFLTMFQKKLWATLKEGIILIIPCLIIYFLYFINYNSFLKLFLQLFGIILKEYIYFVPF